MSSTQVTVLQSVDPVKMLTNYSTTAVKVMVFALAIVTLILVIGAVLSFGSAISDSSKELTGYGLPNALETDLIKGSPLNARTYTGLQNKWLAAFSGLLLAAVIGIATGFIGRVASIDVNKVNLASLSQSASSVGSELGSKAGQVVQQTASNVI